MNNAIPVNVPEGQIRILNAGLIDGSVRVIEDKLALVGIPIVGLNWRSELFRTSYANGYISLTEFPLPINTSSALLEFNFYWGMGFNANMLGATFKSSTNPQGVVLDGRPDPQLENQADNTCEWVSGPQGGLINAAVLYGELGQYVTRTILVRENPAPPATGQGPPAELLAGFVIKTRHLPKGVYHYSLFNYFPVPFTEEKPEEILRMIQQPVRLTAQPLPTPAETP